MGIRQGRQGDAHLAAVEKDARSFDEGPFLLLAAQSRRIDDGALVGLRVDPQRPANFLRQAVDRGPVALLPPAAK